MEDGEEIKKSLEKDKGGVIVNLISGLFIENNKVLLLKRSPESNYGANAWQFPEGKMKFGETPIQTLEREVKEELDIEISNPELFDVSTGMIEVKGAKIHVVRIAYKAKLNGKNFKLSGENTDFRWVNLNEATKMKLVIGAQELIKKILKN